MKVNRKAQSALEYLIILVTIVGAITLFARQVLRETVYDMMHGVVDEMQEKVEDMYND